MLLLATFMVTITGSRIITPILWVNHGGPQDSSVNLLYYVDEQSFLEISRDLDEAATVEGASLVHIFGRVILPNGRPALVTLALIEFMWSWNSFIWPLVAMQDPTKQVVRVSIATFRTVANYGSSATCSRRRQRRPCRC